ncbi:MAG: thioredoxin family protein [Bacteroidales bacterium]|jgi:thiol-disulfide isomerase/thioredoxin|nr:thioredoxin family protein [Bacteroidales bacterium]
MKIFTLLLILVLSFTGCHSAKKGVPQVDQMIAVSPVTGEMSQQAPALPDEASDHVWDFRDATTWLLGDITLGQIRDREPHATWYYKEYNGIDYVADPVIVEELRTIRTDDLTIMIVLGTWCPDSRREVPRFMKLVSAWGLPVEKIRFIGVDINKVAPLGDYPALGIERVPTFIFYENKIETGRIIEVPVTSLEQDTRDILKRKE